MRALVLWSALLLAISVTLVSDAISGPEQSQATLVFREGMDATGVQDWWLKHKSPDLKLVYRFHTFPALLVTGPAVDPSRINSLNSDPAIEFIDTGLPVSFEATAPNDSLFAGQWWADNNGSAPGIRGRDIDMLRAWDVTTGSSDVLVAVIDAGVDIAHPDIAANCLPGYDFVGGHAGVASHPHGTAVAGVIGAVGNNSIGVAGVNWHVAILPLSMYNTAQAAAAIDSAIVWGARIINASWCVTRSDWFGSDLPLALSRAMQAGVIVTSAAGNYAQNMDLPGNARYPASYNHSLNIAVANGASTGCLNSGSNWGGNTVDIAAPGTLFPLCWYNGSYSSTFSGTSVAAPMVAGAAALLIGQYPTATPQWIVDRILSNAESMPAIDGLVAGSRWLNVFRAFDTSDRNVPAIPASVGVSDVTSSQVTLTWIAPGDDGTVGQLDRCDVMLTGPSDSREFEVAPGAPNHTQTLTINGLAFATTYTCRIIAVDDARNRSSARISFTTLDRPIASIRDTYKFVSTLTGGLVATSTWVRNDGVDELLVRASANQGIGWLSVHPDTFAVSAGDSVEVSFVANASGMCGPMSAGSVVFNTNDPMAPPLQTQVFVSVSPAQEIAVPSTVDLGDIPEGSRESVTVIVKNIGCAPLVLSKIRLRNGRQFSLKGSPGTVPAGGSKAVKVSCTASHVGALADTLVVQSDSPFALEVVVPLTAVGMPGSTLVAADGEFACSPNPFNPQTSFQFEVDRSGEFTICIYDVQGAKVQQLSGRARAGEVSRVTWRGDTRAGQAAPSGVYLCRLLVGNRQFGRTLKINLVR
jgi:subtilisin family serine protease